MNKTTNKKLLAGIVMTSALLASGMASALSVCGGTISGWTSCTDGNGDMTFTLNSSTLPGTTGLSVAESTVGGTALYDLGLSWANGYAGGGSITYTVTPQPGLIVGGVNFGTTAEGSTEATKQLFDSAGNLILSLTSTNGSSDPLNGETSITPVSSLQVVDNFTNTENGTFSNADNSFTVTVPEPGSIFLLGVGLIGLVYSRRKMGAIASNLTVSRYFSHSPQQGLC